MYIDKQRLKLPISHSLSVLSDHKRRFRMRVYLLEKDFILFIYLDIVLV